jgi:hypothetical protein
MYYYLDLQKDYYLWYSFNYMFKNIFNVKS